MKKSELIQRLVQSLQDSIKAGSLDINNVNSAKDKLAEIQYKYDENLFPEIPVDADFKSIPSSSPASLAEALLWKMGKWNIYQDFVKNYKSEDALSKKTDVVFAAFAKHLKDRTNPIYDQHALRAMWAINSNLENEEKEKCKKSLIKAKGKDTGKWKSTLSGSETIACYNLYVEHLKKLTNHEVSCEALDKLLMPLGQALKDLTKNYSEFHSLCCWDVIG